MAAEKDLFVPHIAGHLGKSLDEVQKLQKKVDEFGPTAKVTCLALSLSPL